MPTYLCHGFRWHRMSILRHIARNDLEDAALHWIIAPRSKVQIVESLHDMLGLSAGLDHGEADTLAAEADRQPLTASAEAATLPASLQQEGDRVEERVDDTISPALAPGSSPPLPDIILLEEYDPSDLKTFAAPWAYVADYAVRVDRSVSVPAEMKRYEEAQSTRAMEGLQLGSTRAEKESRSWLTSLRDEVQAEECIDWYIVVCGDEARDVSSEGEEDDSEEGSVV
ncbi:uncharacterized protein B0I36DRAFT_243941 [Microdochium trichocladiopsis]|uniref:Uncharacterized protein n=1 Tax=Microdochium trichocladiopsis TaxID=1682393 RepID=A0A9P8Y9K5_9PEZI|nr:uncharacterized protein B0I36DRAFT_243941 [Microdochium trichocladiopsis]KAH7031289.1 hypothetical protein B0I36DRAFT_243941 [Microdochium trichocladiopsis]